MTSHLVSLDLLPQTYAVARLDPQAPIPAWADHGALVCLTRSVSELSIIAEAERVPAAALSRSGFRCLRVQGTLDFEQVGILASLSGALARAGISLLAVSTFDTDYLFVPEAALSAAIAALAGAGHAVHPSNQGAESE